jgi:hypothetical protein
VLDFHQIGDIDRIRALSNWVLNGIVASRMIERMLAARKLSLGACALPWPLGARGWLAANAAVHDVRGLVSRV